MKNFRVVRIDTVQRVAVYALCYLSILSSQVSAISTVTQKIGFAGSLRSSEESSKERSPIYAATSLNYRSSNYHSSIENRRQSHEDLGGSEKHRQIEYNKLPIYGPRSQPEYDNPRNQLYSSLPSLSPYRKIYAVSSKEDYRDHNNKIHQHVAVSSKEDYRDHNNKIHQQVKEPKKYAFAYAVRDGHRGDDFSHKESRDGKVTMGEYKVLLPDGRLQVVRYTADALAGFKADVTYEGEDHPHLAPVSTPKPVFFQTKPPYYGQPSSAVLKQYAEPPSRSETPIYVSTPVKSRPSLSPSIVYTDTDHNDDHYLFHRSVAHHSDHNINSIPTSPSPIPNNIYKVSPTPYDYKKQLVVPSPTFSEFHKNPLNNIGPTTATYYNPTPKNIYEKINASPSPSSQPYSGIPRGHRAGPTAIDSIYNKVPAYKFVSSPAPIISEPGQRKFFKITPTPEEPYVRKSHLVPVEFFKAGPATIDIKKPYHGNGQSSLFSPGYEVNTKQQHYLLEHDGNHHDDHHVEEHYPHNAQQKYTLAPIKPSLATYSSNFVYPSGTPKSSHLIKSQSLVAEEEQRPVRPSIGGLVYLETPGRGPRPNSLGIKELLDRIPHGNLPLPKTTTHPYEVGAKDYGADVNYGNSKPTKKEQQLFIPSQQIPEEYLPKYETNRFRHHSREFLTDDKEDSVVVYKDE